MDNKYDVSDLIVSAIDQKPHDFETAFNNLFVDKLRDAVEQKKVDIAKQMYGYDDPELEDAETEEQEETPEEEIDGEESE